MDANLSVHSIYFRFGFNPRARDGREKSNQLREWQLHVSIHAPVMDANVTATAATTAHRFQSTRP